MKFRLFHCHNFETIAHFDCDEELVKEDGLLVDHETATCRPIANGGVYSIEPIEDHTIAILNRMKQAHEALSASSPLLSHHIARHDELGEVVNLLFGKVHYYIVKSPQDLDTLINPHPDKEIEKKEEDVFTRILEALQEVYGVSTSPEDDHDNQVAEE